jgi:arylsulfatase
MRTHTKPESIGQSGKWQSSYHDTMIDHDRNVATVLKALDDLGIANNTSVMYSTDNGPHMNTWPDAGLLAIAGDTQVTEKLLKGYATGGMAYKVHLDGYNLVPYLTGQVEKNPRESFVYIKR